MIQDKLYTATQAADAVGVHPNTIKRWHREGKINGVQLGSNGWIRIPESEINRILGNTEEDE